MLEQIDENIVHVVILIRYFEDNDLLITKYLCSRGNGWHPDTLSKFLYL